VAQATSERRDRRALVSRIAGTESRQDAALGGKRPTVAVAGGVDYARPNARIFPREGSWKESWDASVNVNWPLFDGGRTRAEVAEAAASRRALGARLEEFDSLLDLEIRQRVAEIQSSRAAIAAAEDAVKAATEAHRVVGERFRAGVATSTDVLSAQVAVTQALVDRMQALANSRLADARLRRALGQ
jgi:outer membrane protein TolC